MESNMTLLRDFTIAFCAMAIIGLFSGCLTYIACDSIYSIKGDYCKNPRQHADYCVKIRGYY